MRCIETLEDYMRASGMKSDHRIEGNLHHFIIQHDLGLKWSVFTEQLLTEIFRGFTADERRVASAGRTGAAERICVFPSRGRRHEHGQG